MEYRPAVKIRITENNEMINPSYKYYVSEFLPMQVLGP